MGYDGDAMADGRGAHTMADIPMDLAASEAASAEASEVAAHNDSTSSSRRRGVGKSGRLRARLDASLEACLKEGRKLKTALLEES